MGMPATETPWTVEMVHALPDDGQRYEVVDGELFVTPSPSASHQNAVLCLAVRLKAYLSVHRVGHVFVAPGDVKFSNRSLVQPDVFVVPLVNGKQPSDWEVVARPLLTVEIVSTSTARSDRVYKRSLYQRAGVPEYWIVDPDARVIERWRPEDSRPEILTERIAWEPAGCTAPMTMDLAEFWGEVFEA